MFLHSDHSIVHYLARYNMLNIRYSYLYSSYSSLLLLIVFSSARATLTQRSLASPTEAARRHMIVLGHQNHAVRNGKGTNDTIPRADASIHL